MLPSAFLALGHALLAGEGYAPRRALHHLMKVLTCPGVVAAQAGTQQTLRYAMMP
jgi:hypothetical protein